MGIRNLRSHSTPNSLHFLFPFTQVNTSLYPRDTSSSQVSFLLPHILGLLFIHNQMRSDALKDTLQQGHGLGYLNFNYLVNSVLKNNAACIQTAGRRFSCIGSNG